MPRVYIPSEFRRLVLERAREVCEYCLISQAYSILSHQVDHIIPVKQGGLTVLWNLALACVECNRHKGTDFAAFDHGTGEAILLFNPRTQRWSEHFRMDGAVVTGMTRTGDATIALLQFNRFDRVLHRRTLIEAGLYPPT
jgi:HNH endonuclease